MLPSACFCGSSGEVPFSVTTCRENRGLGLVLVTVIEGFSVRERGTGSIKLVGERRVTS
jgi:hypothetical protein